MNTSINWKLARRFCLVTMWAAALWMLLPLTVEWLFGADETLALMKCVCGVMVVVSSILGIATGVMEVLEDLAQWRVNRAWRRQSQRQIFNAGAGAQPETEAVK
jgi:hypothetical protein